MEKNMKGTMNMEEIIIIEDKKPNYSKTTKIILIIGAIVGVICFTINFFEDNYFSREYVIRYGYSDAIIFHILFPLVPFLAFLILGIIYYISMSRIKLTVTDKRVYGCNVFNRRVDLPLDSISAVGKGLFKSIAVTTSSGAIRFFGLKNQAEIHDILSRLIVERQSLGNKVIIQESNKSEAEEIKKYKKLLEEGIISQEEFEAKKKQLLGLGG